MWLFSYIPFLIFYAAGIVSQPYFQNKFIVFLSLPILIIGIFHRKYTILAFALACTFVLGVFLRSNYQDTFYAQQSQLQLNQKIVLSGNVENHPMPSQNGYVYWLRTSQGHRIQLRSKTYQTPEKGDAVEIQSKLYVPKLFPNLQLIKQVHAYGVVQNDSKWQLLEQKKKWSTKIREKIFAVSKAHLSPVSNSYFRAMVFGDQAILGQQTIDRLKETGLLHLFVISGFHIAFVWVLGFLIFRYTLGLIPYFHRSKNFFLWIELLACLYVMVFLEWINPPISTFRAVVSMFLFVALKAIYRDQQAIRNLGFVFFVTIVWNPILLFDVSTQLTFSSVLGILLASKVLKKMELERVTFFHKATVATLGASLFTIPILYLHFGTFYPASILYNIIIVPTLGQITSILSVTNVLCALIPWQWLQHFSFWIMDVLFLWFEKILFWKPHFFIESALNPLFSMVLGNRIIFIHFALIALFFLLIMKRSKGFSSR
jgi:ComEC/Rec2-related protein